MRDRIWNYAEEYAEAYIASLVCCRPDGERKRSVRVVCVISIYVLGAPHGLCELLSPHKFGQRPLVLRSLREKNISTYHGYLRVIFISQRDYTENYTVLLRTHGVRPYLTGGGAPQGDCCLLSVVC